jgi:Amidases related to nicotinamidase
MKTLIITDIQNDFIPGGALPVPEGDLIIDVINGLLDQFDLIIATQDWHPANHKSFASNHQNSKAFDQIILNGMEQTLWPDHCVQGTLGADFHPRLDIRPVEAIFRKGIDPEIDSYSCFYDNGHIKTTGLTGYLHEKKVDELYFCGLAGDFCVYYSIKDALKEGFSVTLIENAVRPINRLSFEKIKRELNNNGVTIVPNF